jgi:hypothetical protein
MLDLDNFFKIAEYISEGSYNDKQIQKNTSTYWERRIRDTLHNILRLELLFHQKACLTVDWLNERSTLSTTAQSFTWYENSIKRHYKYVAMFIRANRSLFELTLLVSFIKFLFVVNEFAEWYPWCSIIRKKQNPIGSQKIPFAKNDRKTIKNLWNQSREEIN